MDETRARIFIEQGRIAEAERTARAAVRVQEKGGNVFLFTEALITYGKVLARLERYGAALATFRRVIELSDRAGLANRAAEAALASYREIGEHLLAAEKGQLVSGRSLRQDKRSMEHEVIKLALEQAKGSVSRAARSLGISHQSLNYMLRTRHKDLQKYRTPIRRSRK